MPTEKRSTLLSLPFELQSRIINHVFLDAETKTTGNFDRPKPTGPQHSLLLTCQSLHTTFLPLYYEHLTYHIAAPCPHLSEWSQNGTSKLFQHLRYLSLAHYTQFAESVEVFGDEKKGDEPDGVMRSIFEHFPSLVEVVIDAWNSPGEVAVTWNLSCRRRRDVLDARGRRSEKGFARMLRETAGVRFERGRGVPEWVRVLQRHEYVICWEHRERDELLGEEEDREYCLCTPEMKARGSVEYWSVVCECGD